MRKFILNIIILIIINISVNDASFANLFQHPIKLLNKCISDHECGNNEYCDHVGVNPIGSCHQGKDLEQKCLFDRHCRSKYCHHFRCVSKKPVKDGPCTKNNHMECIESQYCSSTGKNGYVCKNRKCSGVCIKDAHCISDKCSFFACKRPQNGC